MKKSLTSLLLICMVLASTLSAQAAKPAKRTGKKQSSAITVKKLISMMEMKFTDDDITMQKLTADLRTAAGLTTNALDRFIASKYPAYKNSPITDKISKARSAINHYIENNSDYQQTTAGMCEGMSNVATFNQYSVFAMDNAILQTLPDEASRKAFLDYALAQQQFLKKLLKIEYHWAGVNYGWGTFRSLADIAAYSSLHESLSECLFNDYKTLTDESFSTKAVDNAANLRKALTKINLQNIDPEMRDTFSEEFNALKSTLPTIDSELKKLTQCYNAWRSTLDPSVSSRMNLNLSLLINQFETCSNME